MQLSVILPCYNGSRTLAVQLEALTGQHWPGGWEVVAVDNGSTDDSVEIVRRYQDRLPGLKIVQAYVPGTRRLGVPHSYNTGIQAASGDAFVFCEADDEVAPGWLEAMGEALADHPFVVARMDYRKLNPWWVLASDDDHYRGIARSSSPPHLAWASGAAFGMQRSLYEALGALSTEFPMAHDTDYCWRAQLAGYSLHLAPGAVLHYREKTRLKERFVQGRNWARDDTRLEWHYGSRPGRFALLRQYATLLGMLPGGLAAALLVAAGRGRARRKLAGWVWNFGWAMGRRDALVSAGVPWVGRWAGTPGYPGAGMEGRGPLSS
jgi:GT2 family glycosyltransferase